MRTKADWISRQAHCFVNDRRILTARLAATDNVATAMGNIFPVSITTVMQPVFKLVFAASEAIIDTSQEAIR